MPAKESSFFRAVFCHWLDGSMPDVSGETDISFKGQGNSTKRGEESGGSLESPSAHHTGFRRVAES